MITFRRIPKAPVITRAPLRVAEFKLRVFVLCSPLLPRELAWELGGAKMGVVLTCAVGPTNILQVSPAPDNVLLKSD